jgi:hypothetical protein
MGSLTRFSCLANHHLKVPAYQQGKFRNEQFQAWKDVDHSILFMSETQVGFFFFFCLLFDRGKDSEISYPFSGATPRTVVAVVVVVVIFSARSGYIFLNQEKKTEH